MKDVPKDARYDTMVMDFYDYIMGTKVNPFTYEHDYAVQKVITEMVAGDRPVPVQSDGYSPTDKAPASVRK